MSDQCPKCNHTKIIKSGFARGHQRFKCKNCNYQYTTEKLDRGKPLWMKLEAILLSCSGMSLNAIGKHLNVSAQSILNWVRTFARDNDEKPEPGEAIVVELEELWHFIESKSGETPRRRKTQGNAHQDKRSYGSGKGMTVIAGDLSTGNGEIVIVKPSKNC